VTTIAFLGLGLMGTPMATRLVEAGHQVTVWNRDPDKAVPLVARGAVAAATPAAAVVGCAAAVTMLADAAAVLDVLRGRDGMLAAPAGVPATLVQCSTISPAELEGIAAALPSHVSLLDAPVLGSIPQARSGGLRILVGGDQETYQRCRDLLGLLGEPVHIGAAGSASALKLVLNAAVSPMMALLGEALALSDAFGLEEELVLDELARSRIGPLVRRKRAAITTGQFPPDSRLRLFAKDMNLAVQAGRVQGLPMRMTAEAGLLAGEAVAAGLADLDYAALVAFLRGDHRNSARAVTGDSGDSGDSR
jgi:3-hydroxyisobutyrate dehydrogenase-like beta-hydroxyacid dehydrogenase